ncbi:hypothetical protein JCM33374_g2713 [Metschnikowia sp. JCM 33374]|nr:hypothetical protein JCM33374_g2713 [Metschnikowia sp. JCM 33374]
MDRQRSKPHISCKTLDKESCCNSFGLSAQSGIPSASEGIFNRILTNVNLQISGINTDQYSPRWSRECFIIKYHFPMLQFLTLLSLAIAIVQGLTIPGLTYRSDGAPAPLQLDFNVSKTIGNITVKDFWANQNALTKRNAYGEVAVDYRDIGYHMDVYLGSNHQKNTVILDTGSSDLWVPKTGYNPATSTSSKDTGKSFAIAYLDGHDIFGDFYTDTVKFETPNPVLPSLQFATSETNGLGGFGVLGIADKNQEAADQTYDNFPWALKKAGLIPKASYSLFLGPEGGSGSLIFGGIDTKKFSGSLVAYPIVESTDLLAINLQSATFNGKTITVNAPVVLDSGTALGLLNSALMKELDSIFATTIVHSGDFQYRYTSCNQPSDKYLVFNFGGNSVKIAYSDAIVRSGSRCVLGFGWYNDMQIFGDVFLRQAYVYYDLTDQTIAIAQASYSTSSNIISY